MSNSLVVCINNKTLAVTQFSLEMLFNSSASVAGRTFFATSDGLIEISGTERVADSVAPMFVTALNDFGSRNPKRPRFVTISGVVDGSIRLSFYDKVPGDEIYGKNLKFPTKTESSMRVSIPRSVSRRAWAVGISAINGSSFLINSIYFDFIVRPAGISESR